MRAGRSDLLRIGSEASGPGGHEQIEEMSEGKGMVAAAAT